MFNIEMFAHESNSKYTQKKNERNIQTIRDFV